MRFMQTPYSSLRAWTLPLAAACLCLACSARATQTPAAAPSRSAAHALATTNAAPAVPKIPESVFIIPDTPKEGKDPFFPLSTRLRASTVVASTKHSAAPPVDLDLKGISGAADHRLAIINNRTFAVGEEGEVTYGSGRIRITCEEIKDDSVRVLVNGQERVVRLRPGA